MDSAAAATGGGSPFLADRVKGYGLGRDPTGTIKLRGSFRAQLKLRLRLIGAALRQACGEHDLLALGRDGPLALHAPSTGLLAFQHCLTTAVLQQLGNDWQREFIDRAWTKGLVDAVGEVGIDPGYISPDREHELARAELRGIGEAIVQALTRAAAIAQARRLPRVKALRRLVKEFDKFKPRGVAFTNTAVVGAYNRAKIEVYRVAGVTHVGITPEMLPRKLMRDARKRPEPEEYVGEEDLEGVATAGDNDVCEECEDYSADSPYSSDEIELPLHPNCRCAVFPWFDMRRMPEFEETDAGEDVEFIQDPRGRFAGSRPGWGKAKEGGAFEFVSPNIEHLELKTAQKNLGSVRQRALRQASQEIDRQLGIRSEDHDIIGAWTDGAENSMMSISRADWDHLKLSAAMKGHLADQKSVLVFRQTDQGKSVLYSFPRTGSLEDIHADLLKNGLAFHTLVPQKGGAMVYVADLDGSLYDAVDKASTGSDVEYQFGRAEFVGTNIETGSDREQRDNARRAYEEAIRQSPIPKGNAVWTRIRNRWGEALNPDNESFAFGVNGPANNKLIEASQSEETRPVEQVHLRSDEPVTGFLTPEGQVLQAFESHSESARKAGTSLSRVQTEGGARLFYYPKDYVGVDMYARPTQQQFRAIARAVAEGQVKRLFFDSHSAAQHLGGELPVTQRELRALINKLHPALEMTDADVDFIRDPLTGQFGGSHGHATKLEALQARHQALVNAAHHDVTVYHGSLLSLTDKIAAEGLTLNHEHVFASNLYKDDRGNAVFVTTNFNDAAQFGQFALRRHGQPGDKVAVFEVHVPEDEWNRDWRYDMEGLEGSRYSPKDVPADWVKKVTVMGGYREPNETRKLHDAAGDRKVYVVYLVREPKAADAQPDFIQDPATGRFGGSHPGWGEQKQAPAGPRVSKLEEAQARHRELMSTAATGRARGGKAHWTAGVGEKPGRHPLKGYSKEARIDEEGVIHTSNLDDAVKALSENRKIELNQPREVSTLLDKLGEVAADMIAKGEKAPIFDLCNVSVKGTNLFCHEAHNIPRIKMPQVETGELGEAKFIEWLKDRGYKTTEGEEDASYLRASQHQLNGAKVAGIAKSFREGKRTDYKLFVSRDNYVLDGHHRWAADVGLEAARGEFKGQRIKVHRVNAGIIELIGLANKYTSKRAGVGDRRQK